MHLIGVSSLREAFAMVPETTYDVLLRKREQSVDICKYYKAQVAEANKDFTDVLCSRHKIDPDLFKIQLEETLQAKKDTETYLRVEELRLRCLHRTLASGSYEDN